MAKKTDGRGVWLSMEQSNQLTELAWRRRTNGSELIRELIFDAAAGGTKFHGEDTPPCTEKQRSFRMADDEWLASKSAIQAGGSSVAEVVRRGISALAKEEQL